MEEKNFKEEFDKVKKFLESHSPIAIFYAGVAFGKGLGKND